MQGLTENPRLLKGASSLAKPLAKVIRDGISKPAQRGDAIMALLAAVRLATAGMEVDQVLESEKVWEELGKQATLFFSASAAARLPAEEASCSASLVQELLLHVRPCTLLSLKRGPVPVIHLILTLATITISEIFAYFASNFPMLSPLMV